MEHLVESHLGGYYISDEEPFIIEEVCEQCFDSDRIVASWVKGDKDEEILNISNYLCGVEVNEESYCEYLEYSGLDGIIDIKEDIQETFTDFMIIVDNLEESGYIDNFIANCICNNIKDKRDEWLCYIDNRSCIKVLTR